MGFDFNKQSPTVHATEALLGHEYQILQSINYFFKNYFWIPPVVFGIPGNILTMVVAVRKHNRRLSPCTYMFTMAVADTSLLAVQGFYMPFYYSDIGKVLLQPRADWFTPAVYLIFTCGMHSGYVLSAMSVDRLIAVRFPMATTRLCTTSRAKKIVLITFILVAAINVNIFFTYNYVKDPVTGVVVLIIQAPGDNRDLDLVVSGLQILFATVAPFLIILFSNIVIISRIRVASKERQALQGNAANDKSQQQSRKLTRMTIMVSSAYIVTSLPYRVYFFIMDLPGMMSDNMSDYEIIRYRISSWFMVGLWCWNFSINFYLYCLGGGQRYRQDAKDAIMALTPCFFRDKGK